MSCGSIYKIQFPNGKHYIGLTTTSLEQRTKEHRSCAKSGANKCLYNAIRKYDMVDTFELIEIDTADTIEELCDLEILYIQDYNSHYENGRGYNMTYGGEGTNGYVYTEEDKQKMSESAKKYHEYNPDARERMSERMKQYYIDNPNAIEENSKRRKKYYVENPDERERIGEIMKQFNKDHPEAGKEHSERMKQYYIDNPDARERMSEARKKHYEDNPEARQQISDTKGKNKPFDIFTTDGTFIKTFTYQFEALEYLRTEHNITSTIKISSVLTGKRSNSAGFVFKYK